MTFEQCVRESFTNKDLVAEFDRLKGTNVSMRGTGLDLYIDLCSGRLEHDVAEFVKFVKECVWDRMSHET
jgi:hypothetical protein